MSEIGIVKLKNVRLSFPALFTAKGFKQPDGTVSTPKFSGTFLLSKKLHKAEIKAIEAAIEEVKKEKWPKGINPKVMKPSCLHDGGEKPETDGYGDDVMYVSASASKRIPVVDADKSPLTEADGKPYAGCYVNASIRLWAQDNQWGKRINAQLRAVQFVKDGEPFGEKPADVDEEFEDESSGSKSKSDDSDIL